MTNYYSIQKLKDLGVKVLGNNIKVSSLCSLYNPQNIILHDNIRIDDFCILSAKDKIEIFNFVHIACQVFISSSCGVKIEDFVGIASGSKIYGSNDDYSGKFLMGPTVEEKYRNVKNGKIILEKYSSVGAGSIILPNVKLATGSILGALSMLNKDTEPWNIYSGNPAKIIKTRSKECLRFEEEFKNRLI
jgi:galactoside O-acetyltransferase